MKGLITLLFALIATCTFAQHPVKWNFMVDHSNAQPELKLNAEIETGWHIYSQYTPDGGPLPMLITFDSASCYKLIDKVSEPKPIEEFDSVFALKVKFLEGKPMLNQKLEIINTPCKISGRIEYQACKDICIALDTVFHVVVDHK